MTVPELAFTPVVGPGDAPLVVLGPSLGTSTILWEDVIPLLSGRLRVTAWDLPGHGASPGTVEPFSVQELADAVAGGVRDLGETSVLYAGVSLGGATGLMLALRHSSLVERAAIVASGAKLGEPLGWFERANQVRAQSTSSLIISSAERWFAPDSVANRPELSGRLLHALQDADDESYALCCGALAAYDVRDELSDIAPPIDAVWGEFDKVAPEEKAVEIADGVQRGSVTRIAGAAHLPPAEQPEAVASALLAFLTKEEA
ncbi:alpha/beta fold hydrolase [Microbacterium sp. P03]|uniref:alpha/beta fold hydrolase n=1 Tax=Microbacterium sp. P03 TaxID=3366946 RepID=UPI003746C1E2